MRGLKACVCAVHRRSRGSFKFNEGVEMLRDRRILTDADTSYFFAIDVKMIYSKRIFLFRFSVVLLLASECNMTYICNRITHAEF